MPIRNIRTINIIRYCYYVKTSLNLSLHFVYFVSAINFCVFYHIFLFRHVSITSGKVAEVDMNRKKTDDDDDDDVFNIN